MKIKRILAGALAVCMLPAAGTAAGISSVNGRADALRVPTETALEKSTLGNPFLGFDENGNRAYGGDPSILVDGDTVYAYVGHDVAAGEYYSITDYMCYSSKDLINWEYKNTIMDMKSVSWRQNDTTAWASQVIPFKGKYYLLFCTTSAGWMNERSEHCIGVAECDTPDGDFIPMDEPLVRSSQTGLTGTWGASSGWSDIDPTAWVDTDEEGNEKLYITWGNVNTYTCEAFQNEEGHLEVVDQNKNGIVTVGDGDIISQSITGCPDGWNYTEAPYLYRRQNENGEYYGPYYLFFAAGWREQMAYATSEDPMSDTWEWGGKLMPPTATSNTNHEAVFDFNGKTYFVYHNGMLERGSGFRRSACIAELHFNEDGSIREIPETSTGLSGFTSRITDADGNAVAHENFVNTTNDADYPIIKDVLTDSSAEEADALWELEPGKADTSNEAYVSIQSYNKPGLYLSADENGVVLTQDANGWSDMAEKMTFRTLNGFAGYGVTFESVYMPGYYLVSEDGDLKLSNDPDERACTFTVQSDSENASAQNSEMKVLKTKRTYTAGSTLNTDDIRVTLETKAGEKQIISDFTTNAADIDMNKTGKQKLTVSCEVQGEIITRDITIRIVDESETWQREE